MLVLIYDVANGSDDFMDTVLCALEVKTDKTDTREFENELQPIVCDIYSRIRTEQDKFLDGEPYDKDIYQDEPGYHELIVNQLKARGYDVTLMPTAVVMTEVPDAE